MLINEILIAICNGKFRLLSLSENMAKKRPKNSLLNGGQKTLSDYANVATIHGISYVFEKSQPIIERLIWLIIFVSGIFLAGYMSHEGYEQWKSNQVLTSLKTAGTFDKVLFDLN